MELNAIYNALAPGKLVQFRSNYIPYFTTETQNEIDLCENMLNRDASRESQNGGATYLQEEVIDEINTPVDSPNLPRCSNIPYME